MLHPTKVATPLTGVVGFPPVQLSAAPTGLEGWLIVNVTGLTFPTTVLPPESCTATAGWVPNAVAPVAGPGWVVKPSLVAGPTPTVKVALVAAAKPASVACNEYGAALARLIAQPAYAATPAVAA